MKIIGIVQARLGSKRFPRKELEPIDGTPLIDILLQRLSKSRYLTQIVIATTDAPIDDELVKHLQNNNHTVFRGSESDVLSRYAATAEAFEADAIVRITGDCPLIDPDLVDLVIARFKKDDVDYTSNIDPATYPDGLDVEVFSRDALDRMHLNASTKIHREHVTMYLRESYSFSKSNVENSVDHSNERWTVDVPQDVIVVQNILRHFSPRLDFGWKEVTELCATRPELFIENRTIERNEGMKMGTGQKLWQRATRVIPGGNMLLSKRPEMFLPEHWPAYFTKTRGVFTREMAVVL